MGLNFDAVARICGDTFLYDCKDMTPLKQWMRIVELLDTEGLEIVRKRKYTKWYTEEFDNLSDSSDVEEMDLLWFIAEMLLTDREDAQDVHSSKVEEYEEELEKQMYSIDA